MATATALVAVGAVALQTAARRNRGQARTPVSFTNLGSAPAAPPPAPPRPVTEWQPPPPAHLVQRRSRQSLTAVAVAAIFSVSGLALIGVVIASQREPASPPALTAALVEPAPNPAAPPQPVVDRREPTLPRTRAAGQIAPNRGGELATKPDASALVAQSDTERGAEVSDQAASPLPASKPVSIEIPAIDVSSVVGDVGQTANGSLEVPSGAQYNEAAWYRYSPTPGSLGPAVILGHVDSAAQGPSVFFRLGELRPGHRVTVTRADDSRATFVVDAVHRYAKNDFPTKTVYGDIDHAGLRILTCGGAFDDAAGSYLDNIVVFASLVDS